MSDQVREIRGAIVLQDGTASSFRIASDGARTQWDAGRERLGRTVDVLQVIVDALGEQELLGDREEVPEEIEDRPVCEDCGADLSRDEVTETVSRRLLCWTHAEGSRP